MSDDLIKRSDAINAVEEAFDMGDCYCDRYGIRGAINAIPSADRPSKEGEWEIVALGWHSIRRCSNCGWTQTYSDPKYLGYRYNYCPNCGAYMRGKDDE